MDLDKEFKEMLSEEVVIRGSFLHDHATVEKLMQSYVTNHFCTNPERAKEFFEFVICQNITADRTRETFIGILQRNHKEMAEKYSNELRYLNEINESRNIAAHYIVSSSRESRAHFAKTREIIFLKFKNGKFDYIFTKERISDFRRKVKAISDMFDEIMPLDFD